MRSSVRQFDLEPHVTERDLGTHHAAGPTVQPDQTLELHGAPGARQVAGGAAGGR